MDSDEEVLYPESVTPTPTPSVTSSCSSPPPSFRLEQLLYGSSTSSTLSITRNLSVVRSSLPELRTIRVKCRQSLGDMTPPLSVITADMSTTELMNLIFERCHVRGLEPTTYCVVARIMAKGQDIGVESIVLEESSHPFMGDKDRLKRSSNTANTVLGLVRSQNTGDSRHQCTNSKPII